MLSLFGASHFSQLLELEMAVRHLEAIYIAL